MKKLTASVSIFSVAMAMATPSFAQDQTEAETSTTDDGNSEIVVTGLRKSLQEAIETKRQAVGIVEAISSKDIGVLPSVTIAESLARLPGFNTVRDRGNDSQAAIRGLGPRMVLGLINGRELASSEPDRNVRWEIFPSEIVQGVNVYKSSQADLISGGISGTVDIKTLRPLDYQGPSIVVRGGPVYYDGGTSLPQQKNLGFRTSGALVYKLNDDLGFSIAASYQDQRNGYESVGGGGWNDVNTPGLLPGPVSPEAGAPIVATPWGASMDEKALKTTRWSVAPSLQWRASDNLEIAIDGLYSDVILDEHDNGGWYSDWGNWGGYLVGTEENPGYTNNVITNGSLVKTDMTFDSTYNSYVSRYNQDNSLLAVGGNAKLDLGDLTLTGDVAYSEAERHGRWQAVLMYNNAGQMGYDYTTRLPSVYAETDAYEAAQNDMLFATTGTSQASRLLDKLFSTSLDAELAMSGFFTAAKVGVHYSSRAKRNLDNLVLAAPAPLSWTDPVPSSLIKPWDYKEFDVPTMIYGDFEELAAAIYGPDALDALNSRYDNTDFVSKVSEDVIEGYLQGVYQASLGSVAIDGNMGVRIVQVNQDSFGPSNGTDITVSQKYTYVLPSVTARFDLSDGLYVKAGLSRALSRPPLNDLRVDRAYSVVGNPLTGGGGNPYLKPYIADQADLALEWYFNDASMLAVSGYVKRIKNYIGFDTQAITLPGADDSVIFTSPYNNDETGTLGGVEVTLSTPFYFIPGLENFGIYSNASFVGSDIKEKSPINDPVDMNGVAKFTGIVDLWYSDDKFDARVGLKHHSPYTVLFTWSSSALQRVKSETSLDASLGYAITDNGTMRFQVGNILNTPLRLYDNNNPAQIARNDVYGRTYSLDFTIKF